MSGWVCLMYHDVTPQAVRADGSSAYFAVSRSVFEDQLDQVADLGYRVCSVEACVGTRPEAAARRIACSFDDGDAGQFERAFPALSIRGMTATFFITTDWVGRPGYVSWAGLREMKAAGMSLQSHTRSHPFLSELEADALREELRTSRTTLDAELDQQTSSLALPGGDAPRPHLRGLIAEEGYTVVATSRWGVNRHTRAEHPVWINRCTVRGEMPPAMFRRVAQGDSWLRVRKELRETALRTLRASLGATRYARWRRRWFNSIPGQEET